MTESHQHTSKATAAGIFMVGVNCDKTRKMAGSDVVYQVYFELSAAPPPAWGTLFDAEWKALNAAHPNIWEAATIDRRFLIMRCPLKDVAPLYFAVLKKAIVETNAKYDRSVQQQEIEGERRRAAWEDERSDVDAMAKTLQFGPTVRVA